MVLVLQKKFQCNSDIPNIHNSSANINFETITQSDKKLQIDKLNEEILKKKKLSCEKMEDLRKIEDFLESNPSMVNQFDIKTCRSIFIINDYYNKSQTAWLSDPSIYILHNSINRFYEAYSYLKKQGKINKEEEKMTGEIIKHFIKIFKNRPGVLDIYKVNNILIQLIKLINNTNYQIDKEYVKVFYEFPTLEIYEELVHTVSINNKTSNKLGALNKDFIRELFEKVKVKKLHKDKYTDYKINNSYPGELEDLFIDMNNPKTDYYIEFEFDELKQLYKIFRLKLGLEKFLQYVKLLKIHNTQMYEYVCADIDALCFYELNIHEKPV